MLSNKKIIKSAVLLFGLFCGACASAQNVVAHTLKPGETLSALAKQYNTTVGDIMRLNGMNSTSKLQVGGSIKIPATTTTTATVVAPKPINVPVKPVVKPKPLPPVVVAQTDATYTVLKGESLYGIAKKNKTTEAQIKTWNGLSDDNIKIGQVLIVGKDGMPKNTLPATEKPQTEGVAAGTPVETVVKVVKPATPKPVEELTVLTAPSAKVTKKVELAPPTKIEEPATIPSNTKYVDNEGYFANFFNRKDKSATTVSGEAAVFKTTSGWTDKKYYVLMNNVAQGTIVRLTLNNKSVCAKVLGPLPDIKEDIGLLMRMSNAAASVLGVNEVKFFVTVNYL